MIVANKFKPHALAALYNNSKPLGLGILHYDPKDMTIKEAEKLLKSMLYFDYYKGRVMKVDFKNNDINLNLYNRDNGEGAGERVIKEAIEKVINVKYTIYGKEL